VTGALAPYTHLLYTLLAEVLDHPLHVLACSARETARQWSLDENRRYGFEVLPGLRWHRDTVTNHYANPSVITRLLALGPAVAILNDFSPTMALAAAFARLRGLPYGVRTDGVPETDPGTRSGVHRLLRRAVIPGAVFGLGPSLGSRDLLQNYGLKGPFGLSPLFPAWRPHEAPSEERRFDLLFCGSLNEEVKGARFFTDVVVDCAARGTTPRVRIVGDGPLREEMRGRFAEAGVDAHFDGFLQQEALAEAYGSARLFLFPSRGDVWGIVVQEALQSGTVVVASPHSGVARELVQPHRCGLVLPLDVAAWTEAVLALLADQAAQAQLRAAGRVAMRDFSAERAAAAYSSTLAAHLGAR
jgi:glycosyltransferase involved in cell wall biosynthesis